MHCIIIGRGKVGEMVEVGKLVESVELGKSVELAELEIRFPDSPNSPN